MKKMSSMVFLSFIAVSDTCGLFTWNLNHFLLPNGFGKVEDASLFTCKFFEYLQYLSLQTSGLLYSMVSVDRYFTITAIPGSFISKMPFGTRKSALIWCLTIIVALMILNSHILYMQGYIKTVYVNETQSVAVSSNSTSIISVTKTKEVVQCYENVDKTYILSPMWDLVNLAFYNFIPFFIMCIFNTLLIVKTVRRNTNVSKSKALDRQQLRANRRKRRFTVSLCIITVGFIIMTLPASVLYAFFVDVLFPTYDGHAVLISMDCFLFSQHAIMFLMCFITNVYFRRFVIDCIKRLCCRCACLCGRKTTSLEGANTLSTIAIED